MEKRSMNLKRLLASLLCLVMCLSLLPAPYAFAEEEVEESAAPVEETAEPAVPVEEEVEEPAAPAEETVEEPAAPAEETVEEPAAPAEETVEEPAAPAEEAAEKPVAPEEEPQPVDVPSISVVPSQAQNGLATPVLSGATSTTSGVKVTWGAVSGAAQYRVFRKTGSGSWSQVGDTTATYLTDTKAVAGNTYTYTVRCVSKDGKSYTSSYDATGVTTTFWPQTAPVLSGATSTTSGVKVTWKAVSGAAQYRVYRKDGTKWVALGNTTATSFVDKTAVASKAYTYTVRCVSKDGKNFTSKYDVTGVSATFWPQAMPSISSVTGTASGVKVTWKAVSGAALYRVYRKTASGWTRLGDTTGTSYTDTKAVLGQSYTYTVRCLTSDAKYFASLYDTAGKTITYWAYGTPKLNDLTVTAKGITISWKAVSGAPKYRVYRKTASGWSRLADTTGTSYTDTQVVSGTTYTYTVRILTADSKQFASLYDTAGKTATFYGQVAVSELTNVKGGVQVRWTTTAGAHHYRLYKKTNGEWKAVANVASASYTDKQVVSGMAYTYRVRAMNSSGDFVGSYDTTGKTITFYDAPTLDSAESTTNGVTVKWLAVTGAPQYRVYRKSTGGWVKVGDTGATQYTDTTAVSGTPYTYTVRCLSSDGKSFVSGYDTAGINVTYYAAPTLLKAEAAPTGVRVTWESVTGISEYLVYRRTSNTKWTKVGSTSGTGYVDTTAVEGGTYSYTVCCADGSGKPVSGYNEAGLSITYYAAPKLSKVEPVASGKVKISWVAVDGAPRYRVLRRVSGGSWTSVGETTGTSLEDSGLTNGTTYYYTVCVVSGSAIVSGYNTTGISWVYHSNPALSAATLMTNGVQVTWDAVEGVSKYRVFRKTTGDWSRLADVAGDSYLDTTAKTGTAYTYTVRGIDGSGNYITGYNAAGKTITYYEAPQLKSAVASKGSIKVTWTAVKGGDVNGYIVYRKLDGGSWSRIAVVSGADKTTYTDTSSLISGQTYVYTVRSAKSGSYLSVYYTGVSAVAK